MDVAKVKFSLILGLGSILILASLLGAGCAGIPRMVPVCGIQGEGLVSPYLDQEVSTAGLVVAVLKNSDPGGLMILDQECPLQGSSSRGMYITFPDGWLSVNVGDEIRVRGFVRESASETILEAEREELEILSIDNPLPGPLDLAEILRPPLLFGYENWEGQLVVIPQADLQISRESPGQFRILPRLTPGPGIDLVCFQSDSFSLALNLDLLARDPGNFPAGHRLEGLVGLIRQDQAGYFLQLVESPRFRVLERDQRAGEYGPAMGAKWAGKTPAAMARSQDPGRTPKPTSSWTPAPSPTPFHPASPSPNPSPTYYPVRLLISEVFPNPAGDEPGGEWIEIYNPLNAWLLLTGIKIGDEISPDGKEGLLRFPNGYYMEGKSTLVIANQAQVFESAYGFLPDFEIENSHPLVPDLHPYYRWGRSAIQLANSGDEVLLLDPWDQVVDLVVYGKDSRAGFNPPADAPKEGHSLERFPPGLDQDLASDWREQAHPSPGKLDRSTPTQQAAETVTASPSAAGSPTPGAATQTPQSFPSSTFTPSAVGTGSPQVPSQTLPAVLTSTPAPTPLETLSPKPSPTDAIPSLTPLTITESPTMPATSIVQLTPSITITSAVSPTPTAEQTATNTPFPLIHINEILADPDPLGGDSNGDGQVSHDDDEFLELVNISGRVLDLSSWQVYDGIRLRYTFPDGTALSPQCGLVLFGGGAPAGVFGGSLVFTTGSLGLNNGGDLVLVVDQDGRELVRVSYGPEGSQDQSLTRSPDLSSQLPLVLHGQAPGSGGTLFSPGTKVDGSVFGACP